jgi:hypothetical protein
MSDKFYMIQVLRTPDRRKVVYWRLAEDFNWKDNYTFRVGVSLESGGVFEPLGQTDNCLFFDDEQRLYGKNSDLWYQVQVIDKSSEYVYVTSKPAQLQGALSDKAFKIAKRMTKQFQHKLRKGGAQPGFFLKRKVWGTACPSCVDFDVETVVNSHCPVCFGTGIMGGYHEEVPLWIRTSVAQQSRSKTVSGSADATQIAGECIAYPFISPYDVWLDDRTGERFLITEVKNVLELERKPVTVQLVMSRIAETSAVMDVPVKDDEAEDFVLRDLSSCMEDAMVEYVPDLRDEFIDAPSDTLNTDDWRIGAQGDNY